jgi:hypothetical protein
MSWELILKVADIQASCEYYEKIGFVKRWAGKRGEHRVVCLMRHSDLPICLSETWGTEHAVVRARARNVDELYQGFIEANISVDAPPVDQPSGHREMQVIDPDGHILVAWTPAPDPPTSPAN